MFKRKKHKNSTGKVRRAKIKKVKKERRRKKKPVKRKKQHKKINWRKVGVLFLMLCFVVFTVWVLFFSRAMQIEEIKVTGYDEKKTELLEQVEELNKKKIFNQEIKNNLGLFSSNKLSKKIQERFLVIKKVDVQKIFPNRLNITITKREKVFLWQQGEYCKLLDDEAIVVEEFDCGGDQDELLKVCQDKKTELGLDCQIFLQQKGDDFSKNRELVKARIKAAENILEEVRTTFYFEDKIVVLIPSEVSGEIKIKSSNHGELWFSVDKNLERQLTKFRALLEKKISPSDLENMLYIDLRMNNKIVYRFKEGYETETSNP